MKKAQLTLAMLVLTSSCYVGDNAAKEQFIDEDLCEINFDVLGGRFGLYSKLDGQVAEMKIGVKQAGEETTGVRLQQSGGLPMDVIIKKITKSDNFADLVEHNKYANRTQGKLGNLNDENYETLQESFGELENYKSGKVEEIYTAMEEKYLSQITSVPRLILREAARLSAQAKKTGEQMIEMASKVKDSADELDAATQKIYSAIESINAKNQALKDVKISLQNALKELKIAQHGVPDITVFGRNRDDNASIWLHLKRGADGSWDIWGTDILTKDKNGKAKLYSYNPLTDVGERISDAPTDLYPECGSSSENVNGN